jgi:threonine synthase
MRAVDESGGFFIVVSDDEIMEAQKYLARHEGLFVEPASAASLAGYIKVKDGLGGVTVLVSTGHGLKDPDIPLRWGYISRSLDDILDIGDRSRL